MAFSWVGFREAYEADKARRREDELNLQRKAEALLPAVMERRNRESEAARDAAVKLGYLQQRGLSQNALNALYGNSAVLDAIFQESTTGKWVDDTPELLNSRVRSAASLIEEGSSWQDSIAEINRRYDNLDLENFSEEGISQMQEYIYSPQSTGPGGVVEIRGSGDQMVSSEQLTLWEKQVDAFDNTILEAANARLAELQSQEGIEASTVTNLRKDIEDYKTNGRAQQALRNTFGEEAARIILQSQTGFNVGFNNNPFIYTRSGGFSVVEPETTSEGQVTVGTEETEFVVGRVYEDEEGTKWRKTATGWERVDG